MESVPCCSELLRQEFVAISKCLGVESLKIEENGIVTEEICIGLLKHLVKLEDTSNKRFLRCAEDRGISRPNVSNNEVKLMEKARLLESELLLAMNSVEDIKALKSKSHSLIEQLKVEKQHRIQADERSVIAIKKMTILSDHVEKLMKALRFEAKSKIRALEELREFRLRESNELIPEIQRQKRIVNTHVRCLLEVKEGTKILEDQLRLMDEKYLDLKSKLDYAREYQRVQISKAKNEAMKLRKKFAMLTRGESLDHCVMPDNHIHNSGVNNNCNNPPTINMSCIDGRDSSWVMGPGTGSCTNDLHVTTSFNNPNCVTPNLNTISNGSNLRNAIPRATSAPARRKPAHNNHAASSPSPHMLQLEAPPNVHTIVQKIQLKTIESTRSGARWSAERLSALLAAGSTV